MSPSPRLALASAAVVAAFVFVAFVLPAEHGIDPTRAGRLLGLTALADAAPGALTATEAPLRRFGSGFELAPFESLEVKFRLEEGSGLVFAWRATDALAFDLHAEPEDAPDGYAESFADGTRSDGAGTYRAEFTGLHGWFFENRSPNDVTLTLVAAGFADEGVLYRGGAVEPFELTGAE